MPPTPRRLETTDLGTRPAALKGRRGKDDVTGALRDMAGKLPG